MFNFTTKVDRPIMEIQNPLHDILKTLPDTPGVYQYVDSDGQIIYVGKAKNLKKRVSSYFTKNHDTAKTRILVRKIKDIKYIVVDSETDALLLENSLIKKYKPRYNIQLKDDKTYPWICIKNEPFPRVFTTRRVIKDGSKYFGPYPSVKVVNTLLELVVELFPLRNCALDLSESNIKQEKFKVCLEYHLGNCKAPCVAKESSEEYNGYIHQIESIVKGNVNGVIQELKRRMSDAAGELRFEDAALFKDKIISLERYQAKSTIVSPTINNVDVISLVQSEDRFFVNYLMISNGSIIHGHTVEVKSKMDEVASDILVFVLLDMRERFQSNAKEVIVEDVTLSPLDGVSWFAPQRGDKKHLLDLSKRNAKFFRMDRLKQEKLKNPETHKLRILEKLKQDFRLMELPVHMECFDNSNLQGTNAVSACVVFKDAQPSKKDYRHFNIKTVEGPDDFASMREAIERRYKRLLDEGQSLPQLLIVDGGKGQLSAAVDALQELGIYGQLPVVGIAKRLEEIFFPDDPIPLYLDKKSESLKVIQYMRNEAHRFGITHHRSKRSKEALKSELDEIPGIGEKTREKLLVTYKSIVNLRDANVNDLAEIIGRDKAIKILNYLIKDKSS